MPHDEFLFCSTVLKSWQGPSLFSGPRPSCKEALSVWSTEATNNTSCILVNWLGSSVFVRFYGFMQIN